MSLVSPADAVFLTGESRDNPAHVTAFQLFTPPEGAGLEHLDHVHEVLTRPGEVKLAFRRRPERGWSTAGQWTWTDEGEIDLRAHVRRAALPRPGRIRELFEYVSAIHGTLLDRSRPMWEAHLVEGLEDGRWALLTKIHHSLFDGISLSRHMLSGLSEDPADRTAVAPWIRRAPSARRSSPDDGPGAWVTSTARGVRDVATAVPQVAGALARNVATGDPLPFAAPASMINAPLSATRRFAGDSWSRDRLRAVARAADCSVNDVGLAMSAGALRAYLLEQDALPADPLVAMVPVSLRGTDTGGEGGVGNAFGAVLCTLATDLDDAGDRLRAISEGMARGKEQAAGMDALPALALAGLSIGGAAVSTLRWLPDLPRPPFNLIISNVPATRTRLYMDGAGLDEIYPVSLVLDGQALNITMVGYVDRIAFGVTGCARAVPHLQRFLPHLETALADTEKAVGV